MARILFVFHFRNGQTIRRVASIQDTSTLEVMRVTIIKTWITNVVVM
jgi:hypothetical protein